MSARVVVIVQARTGSMRLPGKVLLPLAGAPLLERMIERVQAASLISDLVIATTEDRSDDPIRTLAKNIDVCCYSGDRTDLLDRHLSAAASAGADVVVKIPSDCPLIDPAVIDRVLAEYLARHGTLDYASNLHPATHPDGNDVEVIPINVLELAWREAMRPYEREHTTPFLWERPERFRLHNVVWESGLDYSMSHRFTIDYAEDYRFIAAVYDALYTREQPIFSLESIVELCAATPAIAELNKKWRGVNWYRHHLGELKTVDASMTRLEGHA